MKTFYEWVNEAYFEGSDKEIEDIEMSIHVACEEVLDSFNLPWEGSDGWHYQTAIQVRKPPMFIEWNVDEINVELDIHFGKTSKHIDKPTADFYQWIKNGKGIALKQIVRSAVVKALEEDGKSNLLPPSDRLKPSDN